ncbi:HDOD domain-containing protein [Actinotalea sp. M2MS4P-6]|uniref:HDOD domain-containing protein n=1 Tax=Actinotalea sp. M2MS4P-6 TaxID=2983762 RepID=UPI0021E395EA|nr:HDOD domain-containing protein [Actinotalea sp. M2MS4P-6]MCV2392803.1 HDOD domain-containing protein [Actinotalea sp. M2MS4P-6]
MISSPAQAVSGDLAAGAGSTTSGIVPNQSGPADRHATPAGPMPSLRGLGVDTQSLGARTAPVRTRVLRCSAVVLRAALVLLDRDPKGVPSLSEVIESDPVLALRVLHLANMTTGFREWVDTVPQAVQMLGTAALRSLFADLQADATDGAVPGLERILTRALTCGELSHDRRGFTTGLLSGLAESLGVPAATVLDVAGVSREMSDAVRYGTGPYGAVLAALLAYERKDSLGVARSGFVAVDVYDAYLRGEADARAIAHAIGSS